jgi:hypothetical protein
LDYQDERILVKDQPSATYDMLLKKAEREGRLGGKHKCPICGMRFRREREAADCCKGIAR